MTEHGSPVYKISTPGTDLPDFETQLPSELSAYLRGLLTADGWSGDVGELADSFTDRIVNEEITGQVLVLSLSHREVHASVD
jgi:hypothetical protein